MGDPRLQEEYVQKELKQIYEQRPDFATIREKYLNKLSIEDLNEFDNIIREIMYADGEPDNKENLFYHMEWRSYISNRR